MNVVSFSLWGTDETYRYGAMRNVELVAKHYGPAWRCRFYLFPSSDDMAKPLEDAGAEVAYSVLSDEREGLFARHEALFDPLVRRVVFRDADSRPGAREAELVREWVRSWKGFHSIRDHRRHTSPVMGGMWGALTSALPAGFRAMYEDWLAAVREGTVPYFRAAAGRYGRYSDQAFLALAVWPSMMSDCCMHDSSSLAKVRDGDFFIGQQWHVKNGVEEPIWVK